MDTTRTSPSCFRAHARCATASAARVERSGSRQTPGFLVPAPQICGMPLEQCPRASTMTRPLWGTSRIVGAQASAKLFPAPAAEMPAWCSESSVSDIGLVKARISGVRQHLVDGTAGHHVAGQKQGHGGFASWRFPALACLRFVQSAQTGDENPWKCSNQTQRGHPPQEGASGAMMEVSVVHHSENEINGRYHSRKSRPATIVQLCLLSCPNARIVGCIFPCR